jgi:hypothetical protein
MSIFKYDPKFGAAIAILGSLLYLGVWIYSELDDAGRIPHDEMTIVYSPDWQNGEYKSCSTLNGNGYKSPEHSKRPQNILCDGGVPSGRLEDGKALKVRFWGRTYVKTKPLEEIFSWNCWKNEDTDPSLTCAQKTDSAKNDQESPVASQQRENASKAARLAEYDKAFLKSCVEVKSDATLARSPDIPVAGDLRPRISGRVHTCSHDITDLTLTLDVYQKGTFEELDSAVLTLKGTIPAHTTRGFVEEVHLRLPENGWEWYIEPIKGEVGPLQP